MSKVVRRLSEMGFMRKVDSSDVLTSSRKRRCGPVRLRGLDGLPRYQNRHQGFRLA